MKQRCRLVRYICTCSSRSLHVWLSPLLILPITRSESVAELTAGLTYVLIVVCGCLEQQLLNSIGLLEADASGATSATTLVQTSTLVTRAIAVAGARNTMISFCEPRWPVLYLENLFRQSLANSEFLSVHVPERSIIEVLVNFDLCDVANICKAASFDGVLDRPLFWNRICCGGCH